MAAAALLLSLSLAAAATQPATYVAIGDSTGAGMGGSRGGYPERLAERLGRAGLPVRLVNLCYPGARAGDALRLQLPRALAARPRLVTVGIGINDVLHGTDLDSYRRDLEALAQRLQGSGARVLLVNVPDLERSPRVAVAGPPAEVRARVWLANQAVAEVAARYGFDLVDLFGRGAEPYGAPGTLAADLFHPSDEGYDRWAKAAEPAARRALAAEARPGRGAPGHGDRPPARPASP
jgi:lysophospholipase L1-like esterase